jgi:hypothetical protein
MNLYDRKERREQARARQVAHDKLSTEEKIKKAKSRRGNSKKELARLAAEES